MLSLILGFETAGPDVTEEQAQKVGRKAGKGRTITGERYGKGTRFAVRDGKPVVAVDCLPVVPLSPIGRSSAWS